MTISIEQASRHMLCERHLYQYSAYLLKGLKMQTNREQYTLVNEIAMSMLDYHLV